MRWAPGVEFRSGIHSWIENVVAAFVSNAELNKQALGTSASTTCRGRLERAQRMSQRLHGITSAIQARWFGKRSAEVSLLCTGTTSKWASTDFTKSDAA